MVQAINAEGVIRLQNWRGMIGQNIFPKRNFRLLIYPKGLEASTKAQSAPRF